MRAHFARLLREHDEIRARNHELATMISWAFHKPDKMPKFKKTEAEKKPETSTLADDIRVTAFFAALAMKGEKCNQ